VSQKYGNVLDSYVQVGVLNGLFTSAEWEVKRCVYCCYDAFSQMDVHCCMSSPGGVYAYARNACKHTQAIDTL
jgi:hypothetical protein